MPRKVVRTRWAIYLRAGGRVDVTASELKVDANDEDRHKPDGDRSGESTRSGR